MSRNVAVLVVAALIAGGAVADTLKAVHGKQWYKGQTHMHTLWSDGDAPPELAMKQYKEFGFNFVVMTDHNVLPQGEKWFPVDDPKLKRLTAERLEDLKKMFGEKNVEVRTVDGHQEMRLKTFDELAKQFNEPGKFLLCLGEEVTSRVHINGLNLRERIAPQMQSQSNAYVMKTTVEAVNEQSARLHVPMMAHINHPNFSEGITPGDFIEASVARYFEIFNGHGAVYNWGRPEKYMEPTDRIWDIALAFRLPKDKGDILYGVGTDDAHDYYHRGAGDSIPNRGWSMVLSKSLEANALVEAILKGEYYATSGVLFDEIESDKKHLSVKIQPEDGVTYTTQFIGTRKGFDQTSTPVLGTDGQPVPSGARTYSKDIGVVLAETTDNPATYQFKGDELYVRAKVTSSKLKVDPFVEGDKTMAWTQPVVLK